MSWNRFAPVLLCVALLAAPVSAAPEEDSKPVLSAAVVTALEAALEHGVTPQDWDALHDLCIAESGSVDLALAWLAPKHAPKAEGDAASRGRAAWVAASLRRRLGDLQTALTLLTSLGDKDLPLCVLMQRGSLEDALGKPAAAEQTYARALTLPGAKKDLAVEQKVRLRLALLGQDGADSVKEALVAFGKAAGRDPATRGRVAIVLALKEHPKEATEIFQPEGTGTARFRQEIRLADWALSAEQSEQAQTHAWAALDHAGLKRDRRYALSVLVEAHRQDESLPALIKRFATTEELDAQSRNVWIDLLRETGQIDEALRLFRESSAGRFTIEMRRELLEMCRESGSDDVLVSAYLDLIKEQPEIIEWRAGLSRYYLERGGREDAEAVWASYLTTPALRIYLLAAAESMQALGLDKLAVAACEATIEAAESPYAAMIFLFHLHKRRGRTEDAESALARMDKAAPPKARQRMQLAEAYEQLGKKDRAVEVLEALRTARGAADAGEDLEMRLAWLHSEIGEEEKALERWQALWLRIESVARRRYVEDRLMTVAARLGKLAKIAITLEEKLMEGKADARDSGLLVRLYTKANDAISATEVIQEYMTHSGGDPVKALIEKGRVFLACTDYHNYEKTVEELIQVDPEGKGDYLRQLAMSYLERGKPHLARDILMQLKDLEGGSDSAEFEAGVLALAGLREEAITAYRRGIARFPDRIESYLLLANLLRDTGKQGRAIGMFQHLVESAEKDDLFTIAIDGLLNMEAPAPVIRWARRMTLERIAGRHDKMYLYQLLSDLSEELNDRPGMMRALQSSLPIAGVRRSSVLRELMDLGNGRGGSKEKHLQFGRRLIGLGEIAPPQVYLDLGTAFIQADEVTNAWKTFALATELPDYASFQRQVAMAFEQAGYLEEALRTYERLLVSLAGDVSLLAKVGEVHEQLGRDDRAAELYGRAIDLMLARRLLSTITKEDDKPKNPYSWWGPRNVDEFDQHYARVLNGVLTVLDAGAGGALGLLTRHSEALHADLDRIADDLAKDDDKAKGLAAYPRVESRLRFHRRVAIAAGRPDLADQLDLVVLGRLTKDEELLPRLVRERLDWGLVASARRLIEQSPGEEKAKAKLRFLVGAGSSRGAAFVPVPQASRLYLPLLASGKFEEARILLRRVDFSSIGKDDLEHMPVLLSAAVDMEDGGLALSIGRHWVRALIKTDKQGRSYYTVSPMITRIGALIERDKFRSLCQYVVSLILADLEKAGNWLNLIPILQANFEEPLLEAEQVQELLDKVDGNRWYWVGSFFALVPDAGRAAALRKILPKVPKTRRMQFLLKLLEQVKDEIGADFGDFIVASFDEAVEALDKKDKFVWYQFINLANSDKNLKLRMRLAAVPEAKGVQNDLVRSSHAVLMQKMGQEDEALAVALKVYGSIIGKAQSDFHANMARQAIVGAFLPKHTDAFLAHLDKVAKEGASATDVTKRRLEIASRSRDSAILLAALEQAVAAHPKDDSFKNRLQNQLFRSGRRLEAMALLRKMADAKPKDKRLKIRLQSGWTRMHQPIRALAVKREIEAMEQKKAGSTADKPEDNPKKTKRFVSTVDLKKAVDEERFPEAGTMLRRMWRSFPVGSTNRFFPRMGRVRNQTWPAAKKKQTKAEQAQAKFRARGGLATFSDEVTKPVERVGMYKALSGHAFATDEMRRQIRTWSGPQYGSGGALIAAVAEGLVKQHGRKAAAQKLVATIEQGRAGTLEYALLLSMLEQDSEGTGIDAEAFLVDLSRTVKPSDVPQVQRLARIWARMGSPEAAARLYRWCAAQSPMGARTGYVFVGGAMVLRTGGNAADIVKEVGEELTGDLRVKTVEQILALADPGDEQDFGPNTRDSYESLVIRTWIDVVGEAQALSRCRAICEQIPDLSKGLRRTTARSAARLLAKAGEHDLAVACLEIAVCSLEPPAGVQRWYQSWYRQMGSLGYNDIRHLLPASDADFSDLRGWLVALETALVKWIDADRASVTNLFRPLAILALRLHEHGETERALALLARLEKKAEQSPSDLLWVVDVARELGLAQKGYGLERKMLIDNELIFTRLSEVLLRIAEQEGPAEALELAEAVARDTHYPALLDTLITLAGDAEEIERVVHWQAVRAQAKVAREALAKKKPE